MSRVDHLNLRSCRIIPPVLLSLALVAITALGSCGGSAEPAYQKISQPITSQPIQKSLFGLTLSNINDQADPFYGWPTVPFSGCRLWGAHGTDVLANSNTYSWAGLDRAVDTCVSQGKEVLYTFGSVPNWMNGASPSCGNPYCQSGKPPLNNQDWLNYVTALVQRYKGKIKYYELWNEPCIYPYGWTGSVPQLMRLVRGEYETIKRIDPDALTISPAVGSNRGDISYFTQLLQNGAGKYADFIGIHGYTTAYYKATSETRAPEAINKDLSSMRAAMVANGVGGRQLVDTESSWSMCTDKTTGFCGNEDLQAAFVAVRYVIYAMNGVHSYWWYAWDGDTEGDSFWGSLYHTNGRDATDPHITKAGVAYGQIQEWLVGAYPGGCTFPSEDTWSCAISRPGGYSGLIVWDSSGSGTLTIPDGMIRERKLDGSERTVAPGSSIALSYKPILLENMAASKN